MLRIISKKKFKKEYSGIRKYIRNNLGLALNENGTYNITIIK